VAPEAHRPRTQRVGNWRGILAFWPNLNPRWRKAVARGEGNGEWLLNSHGHESFGRIPLCRQVLARQSTIHNRHSAVGSQTTINRCIFLTNFCVPSDLRRRRRRSGGNPVALTLLTVLLQPNVIARYLAKTGDHSYSYRCRYIYKVQNSAFRTRRKRAEHKLQFPLRSTWKYIPCIVCIDCLHRLHFCASPINCRG